jgi:hypothetical protein
MSDLKIKDVCYPRKYMDKNGEEKTNWIKIGTSFEKIGGHHNIEIYTLPVSQDGKIKISLFEKKKFEENPF